MVFLLECYSCFTCFAVFVFQHASNAVVAAVVGTVRNREKERWFHAGLLEHPRALAAIECPVGAAALQPCVTLKRMQTEFKLLLRYILFGISRLQCGDAGANSAELL
jgi:hypothetical protein